MKKILIVAFAVFFVLSMSFFTAAKSTGKNTNISEDDINSAINQGLEKINSDEKYIQFIENSSYDSCEIIVDEREYYFMYDGDKIVQSGKIDADFNISITSKKLMSIVKKWNAGNYWGAAMNAYWHVPGKVRNSLIKQCKNTEWCRKGDF